MVGDVGGDKVAWGFRACFLIAAYCTLGVVLDARDGFAIDGEVVAGDSMEEAGILDGDTVIIKKADTAADGTIVVALIDGFEVTLKTLRRRGKTVILEPANTRYEPRIFSPDRILIQGVLVGLIRSYNL